MRNQPLPSPGLNGGPRKNRTGMFILSIGLLFPFCSNALEATACFTPQQDCTALIVHQIDTTHHSLYMQAYSFTSWPIAKALVAAKKRGVNVEILFDKTNFLADRNPLAEAMLKAGIPCWVDDEPNIAHNKVMIFDGQTVETGSFNYTHAAQNDNAENVLIVNDSSLAKQYLQNWQLRQKASREATEKTVVQDPEDRPGYQGHSQYRHHRYH